MVKRPIVLFWKSIVIIFLITFCSRNEKTFAIAVKDHATKEICKLEALINTDLLPLAIDSKDTLAIKKSFLDCRKQFKVIEYYIEYFFPSTAKALNGPPINEIELGENLVEPPGGFQVIEDYLYNDLTPDTREELVNEIKKVSVALKRIQQYQQEYTITNEQIFDAMLLELFRITALGITGFDTPLALRSLDEAASSLTGLKQCLSLFPEHGAVSSALDESIKYIQGNNDFNNFNRLDFITEHLSPLGVLLNDMRNTLKILPVSGMSALNNEVTSLFKGNVFNINKFVSNKNEYFSKERAALGKVLFTDVILSNGNNKSCASCHHSDKVFTDGLTKAIGIDKQKKLLRNTPTLKYAGFQRAFFYDHKAGTLEDQALDVVHNEAEMQGALAVAAEALQKDQKYAGLFRRAYGADLSQIDPWKIQHALASYIRSLAPFSSKFDRYMLGDHQQLNELEKKGFNLFMGKAKCATCHFVPLFNGTPAPLFDKSETEVLGVPSKPDTVHAVVDGDKGRFLLSPYDQYMYSFKTPTLRNIAETAPYMHNGVYKTLEEVMDFYNRGGGAGIGISLDNQTLSDQKLNLSRQEIVEIIAFMKTLTDN
ncbi:MAG TPA: cytochrome c peroxidase [Pseudosphingobacterium sp.]|nr:cytochrome c peroxidase [Pseudosphingobacterium sp.]